MSKSLILMLAVLCLFILGCSKSETTTNRDLTATATNKNAPATAAPTTTTSASSSQKVGVAECDAFIAAYEACVNEKVPAAARAQLNSSLAQWRKRWHDLAANPQTKPTLVQACKSALEQARQSTKPYGCTF
jgi:hypothetical protein